MTNRSLRGAIGGVGLIVLCFVGSAALRLGDFGAAIADELDNVASVEGTAKAASCTPDANADALLAAIREREAQLEAESKRLAERAQTLNVAEAKLAEQLAAFEKARTDLEATLALADKAAERDIAQMTTVYENMKPDDAAKIFERMDVTFASGLLVRMRPDLAAEVLTSMNADTAYALTLMITSRNAKVPTE